MELGILIATLSLLVTALAEIRATLKDQQQEKRRSIGVALLQFLLTLDEILITGEKLIAVLASTPLEEELDRTSVLVNKKEILTLLEKQQKNLQTLSEIIALQLSKVDSKVPTSLGQAIEFMVGDEFEEITAKWRHLRVLSWKLLEGTAPFSTLSIAVRLALKSLEESTEIDARRTYLSLKFPTKVSVRVTNRDGLPPPRIVRTLDPWRSEAIQHALDQRSSGSLIRSKLSRILASIYFRRRTNKPKENGENELREIKDVVSYDLTKPRDLRRLLEHAKDQLEKIRIFREQIAQITLQSFTMDDLINSV